MSESEGPRHPWSKWPKIRPETVAPLRDGKPDLYSHQPTRFVSAAEAEGRGWHHFWTGEPCVAGHRAARYVSNGSVCVDCERIKKGKVPVYGKGVPELEARLKRTYTMKNTVPVNRPPQPTASEKLFLEKYADCKDFSTAADACGRSESEFLAILSWNTVFRDAVNRLEESLGMTRTQEVSEYFDWDDAKRRSFLLTYANTADVKQSLRSVGATNVQFHRELSDNPDFQRGFDDANNIARAVFDHAAAASATKGDARMLGRIAANFFPEKYGETSKIDLNVKQNMSVDQIHAQIASIVSGLDRQGLLTNGIDEGSAIDAEYSEADASEGDGSTEDAAAEGADPETDPNSDLVSGP